MKTYDLWITQSFFCCSWLSWLLFDWLEEMLVVILSDVFNLSSPSFSPVSGTFPVLLQLPNGQTMPVAIPASITSSSVHIPTTIPVSLALVSYCSQCVLAQRFELEICSFCPFSHNYNMIWNCKWIKMSSNSNKIVFCPWKPTTNSLTLTWTCRQNIFCGLANTEQNICSERRKRKSLDRVRLLDARLVTCFSILFHTLSIWNAAQTIICSRIEILPKLHQDTSNALLSPLRPSGQRPPVGSSCSSHFLAVSADL